MSRAPTVHTDQSAEEHVDLTHGVINERRLWNQLYKDRLDRVLDSCVTSQSPW